MNNEKRYYCDNCKDTLCIRCVEFPWECPEGKICKTCLEEIEIVKEVYVLYLKQKDKRVL